MVISALLSRLKAKTEEELRETAEFWHRAGWRDRIVSNEEIKCMGCGTRSACSFMLLPCTIEHGVKKCRECSQFKCEKVRTTLEKSYTKMEQCREACDSEEEFEMLCRAFYEKERNM